MSYVTPEKQQEIDGVVAEVLSRRPNLGQVIARCCVGWDVEIPSIVYQALVIKLDEYIQELGPIYG